MKSTTSILMTTLSAAALLGIATATNAATTTYIDEGFESYGSGTSVCGQAEYSCVPSGGVGLGGTIVSSNGGQAVELNTTVDDGGTVAPGFFVDLTAPNGSLSDTTTMTTATVSLDFNYNYVSWNKSYEHDVWIYVHNHKEGHSTAPSGGRVAAVRLNGGYYDWKFGVADYGNGAAGSNVRDADYHSVEMVLDFAAQTVTYNLDGTFEKMDQFPAGTLDGTKGLTQLYVFNGMGGNGNNTDYVDNVFFSADVSEIPEPGTLALLGMGGLMLIRRRWAA